MTGPADIDRTDPPDQHATEGTRRPACLVIRNDDEWIVAGHAETVQAATHSETFSSNVTARRAIPNSLDGAEHTAFRVVVERYLTPERVAREEPPCRAHALAILQTLPRAATVDTLAQIGLPFAVRAQSSWLGWPPSIEPELLAWIRENDAATRSGDRDRTMDVAERFDTMIRGLIRTRRDTPHADVTSELMNDTVHHRALTDTEIVSILRNWTAGDLRSLAACVGVIVHHLATNPRIQNDLRRLVEADEPTAVEAAIEEILRIDDPFVSNRRRTTGPAVLGGQQIPAGARVVLNWSAANRDTRRFPNPDAYNPRANAAHNLVFGAGPHRCPGRALTLMELRVVVEELCRNTDKVVPAQDRSPVREKPPRGGWVEVPIILL